MNDPAAARISPELILALAELDDPEDQASLLKRRGFDEPDSLRDLLAGVSRMVDSDPVAAGHFAEAAIRLAVDAELAPIVPMARYVRAQVLATQGQWEQAAELIVTAKAGFEAVGDSLGAMRTNLGSMHVLTELGRHAEALSAGEAVLDTLVNGAGAEAVMGLPPERMALAAAVLHNRATCLNTLGRHRDALSTFEQVTAVFHALGDEESAGMATLNRGVGLLALGRAAEAEAAFEAARDAFEVAGLPRLQIQATANLAGAWLARGDAGRALNALETAREALTSTEGGGAEPPVLAIDRADALMALNQHADARAAYAGAVDSLRGGASVPELARGLRGLGAAEAALGRPDEADRALDEAAALAAEAGNSCLRSAALLERSGVAESRGQGANAVALATEAAEAAAAAMAPIQLALAHLRLADLAGKDRAGLALHLSGAREAVGELDLPLLTYRLHHRQGRLARLEGRTEDAVRELEAAVQMLELAVTSIPDDALRVAFMSDKAAVYEDLIGLHLDAGTDEGVASALAVADRSKSRSLFELMTAMLDRRLAADPAPAVAARLAGLKAELSAIYSAWMHDEAGGQRRAGVAAELRLKAQALTDEIAALSRRGGSFRSALPGPRPARGEWRSEAVRMVGTARPPVLAYHTLGDELIAFVASEGAISVVRDVCDIGDAQWAIGRLSAQWERFKAGGDFARMHAPRLLDSALRALVEVYDLVVRPVESALGNRPDGSPLVVVPHGCLYAVPFHALYDGERYLVDRFSLSYAPSIAVLERCMEFRRPSYELGTVLGVGDAGVPLVRAEARSVAGTLPGATLFLDEDATLAALRVSASGSSVVHLACHGLHRSDSPMYSALRLGDGWLTARDALDLELNGALVTLSACESGRTTAVAGGGEPIGLARGFLGAGAATVVVSLWLADDAGTASLMTDWYGRMANGVAPAVAMRQAQRHIRRTYPHPYYWAPFVVVGRR